MNEINRIFTVSGRARIARRITQSSAELKPWQLRNKRNRRFALLAKYWNSKRGYMIASVEQMKQLFPELFNKNINRGPKELTRLRIWAVCNTLDTRGYTYLSFASV